MSDKTKAAKCLIAAALIGSAMLIAGCGGGGSDDADANGGNGANGANAGNGENATTQP